MSLPRFHAIIPALGPRDPAFSVTVEDQELKDKFAIRAITIEARDDDMTTITIDVAGSLEVEGDGELIVREPLSSHQVVEQFLNGINPVELRGLAMHALEWGHGDDVIGAALDVLLRIARGEPIS